MINPLDLVRSRGDGSISLTKLAATTFHLQLALTVGWLTYRNGEFNVEMWLLYAAFAVGHASYDKTMAVVKDFKDRKLATDGAVSQAP